MTEQQYQWGWTAENCHYGNNPLHKIPTVIDNSPVFQTKFAWLHRKPPKVIEIRKYFNVVQGTRWDHSIEDFEVKNLGLQFFKELTYEIPTGWM